MVSGVAKPHVLLSTEGTYPFHLGGVSTWCDTLVHQLPDIHFDIFAIAMNPYVSLRYAMPANVGQVIPVPLWGMQDPSEHRTDVIYSEIFLQKQRTDGEHVRALFLPPFQQFLRGLAGSLPPGELGQALAAMYRYFRTYDYQVSFKTEQVWEVFKEWELQAAHRGLWDEPSVFESVQSIGWIYHFLTVLNTSIPHVDVVHSSAAAFCGMVGIVSKLEYGTPTLVGRGFDLSLPGVTEKNPPQMSENRADQVPVRPTAADDGTALPGLESSPPPLASTPPLWTDQPSPPAPAAAMSTPSPDQMADRPPEAGGLDVRSFMFGKHVGQDVSSPDGTVLARTGDLITPELVAQLEQAGRLPDLIVHMVI